MNKPDSNGRWCAALQPHLFPTVGDFWKMFHADLVLFADHLQFSRASLIRRACLPGGVTGENWFSLSVARQQKGPIGKISVQVSNHWRRKLLTSLKHSLGWAPFCEEVVARVAAVFTPGWHLLGELLWQNLLWQVHMAGFRLRLYRASEAGIQNAEDVIRFLQEKELCGFVLLPEEAPYYQKHFAGKMALSILPRPPKQVFPGLGVHPERAAVEWICRWGTDLRSQLADWEETCLARGSPSGPRASEGLKT